ncbi:MAG: hypothetical protein EOO90_10575 [Pedobacter sp.]|nr:MAG: hypothetical protein EOO90_10575 [Pedobacter sp.]
MRTTLRSFALLDLLSLVFLAMQVWTVATQYDELPDQVSVKLRAILMFLMFILISVGTIYLFLTRKMGIMLYYIQFPFRLYLWIFSLGFITLLPEALGNFEDFWADFLLKICFMGEFVRLYLSISAHRKMLSNNI